MLSQQSLRITTKIAASPARFASLWAGVPEGPADPILGLTEAWRKDPSPAKINVGVGAYRDANGKAFVLPSVRKAEAIIAGKNLDKEYASIEGHADFRSAALKFALGKDLFKDVHAATVQSISGTGALRLGGEFLRRFHRKPEVALPDRTWPTHDKILNAAGVSTSSYRYYDASTISLNFKAMVEDLTQRAPGSAVLLHACAHNPTGIDPTQAQWEELAQVFKTQKLLPFFDMAYQGFASGDPSRDAFAVRHFVQQGLHPILTQSFAKNMGLYGERVGAFTVLCETAAEASAVLSQLKLIIRPMYSSPPINGARIATHILNTPELTAEWEGELKLMSGRIIEMRETLVKELKAAGSTKNWDFITKQIGMFCYSGMTAKHVQELREKHSIYMTSDGRISMVGLTHANVGALARAMHAVTKA
ncbi:aspartate transaminase [Capsaspora owczarzaki ATCC 30864]|uniref:Aspartate aminotransferase n=1 Tax=Capsaspora owczarzaki (strain ATCC 30864) TaxID=595528 RepID=A0A0D2W1N0_CAPO3|nr:aspartate transaminase [Capsaspora owczarzaki ATCC 30864]KJE98232.1 aspartate transaminase [Capsaspora owczarzaki ATCC 30864]|eukprot:XP_004342483.1 aspartate transaminase [Capsaspora owczarzaki ATCC 30864]